MEQLIMVSNKSNKKSNHKSRMPCDPTNLLFSWNKNDNTCIPLKINNPTKNKNLSSKKIKLSSFPILENTKMQKRQNNSSKLLTPNENSILIPKIKKSDNEQTKINSILPKINNNSSLVLNNKDPKIQRKSQDFI